MPEELMLDTHAWVSYAFGLQKNFSRSSLKSVQRALKARRCHLSVISIWEVGLLAQRGRLRLKQTAAEWVREALLIPGLILEPLTVSIALNSTALPGNFHADPADRFLVATAKELGLTFVTGDERILDYGRQGYCSVLEC